MNMGHANEMNDLNEMPYRTDPPYGPIRRKHIALGVLH